MPIVLIISLHKERYESIVEKYKAAGGKYETIHVPGVLVSKTQRNENCSNMCRFFCSDSLVGCFLAHRNAWEIALKYDETFIYEDDIEFQSHFNEAIALEMLKNNDVVALGNMSGGKVVSNLGFFDDLVHFAHVGSSIDISDTYKYSLKFLFGLHGYLISSKSAQKILELLPVINEHVDQGFTNLFHKKLLKGIGIRPSMVSQGHFSQSTQSTTSSKVDVPDRPGVMYLLNYTELQIGSVKISSVQLIIFFVLVFVCLPVAIFYFIIYYLMTKLNSKKGKTPTFL